MNTYIQNKLDEFDKRFVYPLNFDFTVKEYTKFLDDSSMADGYGSAADYLKEFIEQALTDYHNHIVEKIEMLKRKNYNETAFMNHRNYYNDAHNEVLQGVINFLQDTNQ